MELPKTEIRNFNKPTPSLFLLVRRYTCNVRPAKFTFFESLNTRKWHILQCTPKVEKQYSTSMILKIFLHCSVQRYFKKLLLVQVLNRQ